MNDRPSPIRVLWALPAAYGVFLLVASVWWLAVGEPFDQHTYERVADTPWSALRGQFTPSQSAAFEAMVRLLGGNGGLLAGSLTIAVAVFGYRPGFRWAWFAMWFVPLHALIDIAIVTASAGWSVASALWDIGWASAIAVALATTYPR